MADDRLFLECRTCGAILCLLKSFAGQVRCPTDSEQVTDWCDKHLRDCSEWDYVRFSDWFRLTTEDDQ